MMRYTLNCFSCGGVTVEGKNEFLKEANFGKTIRL